MLLVHVGLQLFNQVRCACLEIQFSLISILLFSIQTRDDIGYFYDFLANLSVGTSWHIRDNMRWHTVTEISEVARP